MTTPSCIGQAAGRDDRPWPVLVDTAPGAARRPGKHLVGVRTDTLEMSTGKTPAGPSLPPCLVNLFLDPAHPCHFALTAERIETVSGAPGSCLDLLKTHVRDTVGTDAFLRAIGTVSASGLEKLLAKALAEQGHSPQVVAGKTGPLAEAAAVAGLVLLEERIASSVLARIQAHEEACEIMLGDPAMRLALLAKMSALPADADRARILAGFGLDPGQAGTISHLLGPWIPQEIEHPTGQSAADVAKADALLAKGLGKAHDVLEDLEPEVRFWQVSNEIDLLSDFGPVVDAALADLGLPPSGKGQMSALTGAIEAHVEDVDRERAISTAIQVGISLVTGPAGKAASLTGGLPSLLAGEKKLEDALVLRGLGIASDEAVDEARDDLLLGVLVTVAGTIL